MTTGNNQSNTVEQSPELDSAQDRESEFPLPLLITGTAGVAGFNAFHHFRRRFGDRVIGLRPFNNWPLKGPGIVACDLEDRDGIRRLADRYQFRSVLSCGGSCALKSCELDPQMAHRVNVFGLQCLLDAISEGTRLVHLSIDLVFSGTGNGDHLENDPVDPVTVYGKTMVQAEEMVKDQRPDAAILRISLPMGISFNGHAGAIDWIQSRFAKNRPATLYFDEIRTPSYTECLNRVFDAAICGDLAGVFHCGGPRKMSLYQIAQVVNRVGGYHPDLLQGCPRIDAGPIPPRAGNVTMNSQKLLTAIPEISIDPWPLDPAQVPNGMHWHYQRDDAEPGSPEKLRANLYQKPRKPTIQVG